MAPQREDRTGGSVYRCEEVDTGRELAAKIIRIQDLSPAEIEAIKREVRTMKRLEHRYLVRYVNASEKKRQKLIIYMEYVAGGSLSSHVKRDGALPIVSLVGGIKGTPHWMAPEVIREQQTSEDGWLKADIWSLGCAVLEMLTGHSPWQQYSNPLTAMYQIVCSSNIPTIPADASEEPELERSCLTISGRVEGAMKASRIPRLKPLELVRGPHASTNQRDDHDGALSPVATLNEKAAGEAAPRSRSEVLRQLPRLRPKAPPRAEGGSTTSPMRLRRISTAPTPPSELKAGDLLALGRDKFRLPPLLSARTGAGA
ncbi:hypothetical protein PybrP1_009735 [[Pythium] brassicae (nom. inval.)]|nr:hypothetical protein PybrP1_009735 [[Pythium] brassicae (nom. inval.)]